jgi:MoaA/NifB/PqqE/SkfB family radical SAM enzyme
MLKELSYKLLSNYFINYLSLKIGKNSVLKPLFFSFYLTLSCNFNCRYCDFAQNKKENLKFKQANTQKTIELLKIIRKECDAIYFTGGEPLIRNDIIEILKKCKTSGFKSITINTNMSLMHRKLEVLEYITNLVASLDLLDEKQYAKVLGVPISDVIRVKENILKCAKLQQEEKFLMTVNCVVIPETIHYVPDLMNFCFEHNIRFAIVPAELAGGEMNPLLKNNEDYRRLIESVINAKKNGKPVFGSYEYLKTIRDFSPFNCCPTLCPHIYPNGDLFYPCEPLKNVAANLLTAGSYKKAIKTGLKKFGSLPSCKDRCYKACYIESTNFIKNPKLIISEFVG